MTLQLAQIHYLQFNQKTIQNKTSKGKNLILAYYLILTATNMNFVLNSF